MDSIYKKNFKVVALVWAGCLVLFAFVYIYVLSPQRKTKKQLDAQLAKQKQMYDAASKAAQEETKARLNEQVERLQNSLKDFVIDFEDSANLTLDISQIASQKRVDSFSIEGKTEGRNRGRGTSRGSEIPGCEYIREDYITVNFAAAGFTQFAGFLNALERHRPVIFIDKFQIERSKKQDSSHEVSMDLAVFVRKRSDTATANAIGGIGEPDVLQLLAQTANVLFRVREPAKREPESG